MNYQTRNILELNEDLDFYKNNYNLNLWLVGKIYCYAFYYFNSNMTNKKVKAWVDETKPTWYLNGDLSDEEISYGTNLLGDLGRLVSEDYDRMQLTKRVGKFAIKLSKGDVELGICYYLMANRGKLSKDNLELYYENGNFGFYEKDGTCFEEVRLRIVKGFRLRSFDFTNFGYFESKFDYKIQDDERSNKSKYYQELMDGWHKQEYLDGSTEYTTELEEVAKKDLPNYKKRYVNVNGNPIGKLFK